MDEIVLRAMAKWPDVPDCHGWLGLDARGNWYLRDALVQARGGFMQARGERIEHRGLIDFIGRNYAADGAGCWYFQNGPQRVFVELECTPWIWRLHPDGAVVAHQGRGAGVVHACLLDRQGRAYLRCDGGVGIVHSQDMVLLAQWLGEGRWPLREIDGADLAQQEGFVLSPARQHK